MKYEKQTNIMNPQDIKHVKSDSNFGYNPGRSHNKSFMPSDMDANVAFVMTDEQTDIQRKDYEFRLEINNEREEKFPIFAENIKQFQLEVDEIMGITKHTENNTSLSNDQYWDEVSNETGLLKLERSMERINKFARRDIEGDQTQHERREKRQIDRAIKRKAGNISHKI